MGLKRKRSFTTLSSPSSTSSHLSISPNASHYFHSNAFSNGHTLAEASELGFSPPEPYIANGLLLGDGGGASYTDSTPSHLNSRTRKRLRDNRPDEASVHSRTLELLFSAQQRHNDHTIDQPLFDSKELVQTAIPNDVDCDHGMLTPSPTPAHSRLPSEPCFPSPLPINDYRRMSSPSVPLSKTLQREPGQKTLHSFFPSDPTTSTKRPSSAHVQSITNNTLFSSAAAASLDDAMDLELPPDYKSPPSRPPTASARPLSRCSGCDTALPPPPTLTPLSTSFSAFNSHNTSTSSNLNNPNHNQTLPLPPGHAPEFSDVEIVSMDVDIPIPPPDAECLHFQNGAAEEFACGTCGKSVCDTCAVRNGGERRCLECAMPGNGNGMI